MPKLPLCPVCKMYVHPEDGRVNSSKGQAHVRCADEVGLKERVSRGPSKGDILRRFAERDGYAVKTWADIDTWLNANPKRRAQFCL
jgi:hypothetical protein